MRALQTAMNPSAVITPRATGAGTQSAPSPNTPRGESSNNVVYLWDTAIPDTKMFLLQHVMLCDGGGGEAVVVLVCDALASEP